VHFSPCRRLFIITNLVSLSLIFVLSFSFENSCLQAISSLLLLLFVRLSANWISQFSFVFSHSSRRPSVGTSCLCLKSLGERQISRALHNPHKWSSLCEFHLFIYYFWTVGECLAAFLLISWYSIWFDCLLPFWTEANELERVLKWWRLKTALV